MSKDLVNLLRKQWSDGRRSFPEVVDRNISCRAMPWVRRIAGSPCQLPRYLPIREPETLQYES
jgi:hypothetical protein